MTKKQLLNLLITHYENVIVEIAMIPPTHNIISDARSILSRRKVHYGICYCAQSVFNKNIMTTSWVDRHAGKYGYWADKPYFADSISKMIDLLQYRVDIMQKLEKESLIESLYKNVIHFFNQFK